MPTVPQIVNPFLKLSYNFHLKKSDDSLCIPATYGTHTLCDWDRQASQNCSRSKETDALSQLPGASYSKHGRQERWQHTLVLTSLHSIKVRMTSTLHAGVIKPDRRHARTVRPPDCSSPHKGISDSCITKEY